MKTRNKIIDGCMLGFIGLYAIACLGFMFLVWDFEVSAIIQTIAAAGAGLCILLQEIKRRV